MTSHREIKNHLYGQVARIGKAAASPKRLELIELLCQEKKRRGFGVAGRSEREERAHLKDLKAARLMRTRKEGKYVRYRLADEGVARFWVTLRRVAEERLVELQQVEREFLSDLEHGVALDRRSVVARTQQGEVIVIDMRPADEFDAGHLPFARSIPLPEMKKRLNELPCNKDIVAYCRGPFGLLANDAVALLRQKGFRARRLDDGVAEWRAAGLPIESNAASR